MLFATSPPVQPPQLRPINFSDLDKFKLKSKLLVYAALYLSTKFHSRNRPVERQKSKSYELREQSGSQDKLASQQLEFGQQTETTGTMEGYIVCGRAFVNINLIFALGRIQVRHSPVQRRSQSRRSYSPGHRLSKLNLRAVIGSRRLRESHHQQPAFVRR